MYISPCLFLLLSAKVITRPVNQIELGLYFGNHIIFFCDLIEMLSLNEFPGVPKQVRV